MDHDEITYNFKTIDQSAAYRLTSDELVVTYRKGLSRSMQSIPLNALLYRQSSWEMSNQTWLGLCVVSVVAIVFGVWGLVDPVSTGMYTVVGACLILAGVCLPVLFWKHRKLVGVTWAGHHDFSIAVIGHAAPPAENHQLLDAIEARIQDDFQVEVADADYTQSNTD